MYCPEHAGSERGAYDRLDEVLAENERLRAELAKVEAVMVAADRVHEAYEAMLEGRDLGRLPEWQ